MKKFLMTKFNSQEWNKVDRDNICFWFVSLGFKQVGDLMSIRVFDLLNLDQINNNRAEEMLLCLYHLMYPNAKLDEGIYYDEIDQYFSYREWKKKHKRLEQVTVSDVLLTEGINEAALLRIFDGITAAFYKSNEYNSRKYRYGSFKELLDYRISIEKEGGNGQTK